MTETLLLDNLAYRAGESFDWDAEQLQVPGSAKAAEYIRTPFRRGWGV